MSQLCDEVILFRGPGDESHLVVFNLPPETNEQQFTDMFSPYGFIHEVQLNTCQIENEEQEKKQLLYGFVTYYSINEANAAMKTMNGHSVGKYKLKVQKVVRKKKLDKPSSHFRLQFQRCVEVANTYLGFNTWKCSIVLIRPYDHQTDSHLDYGLDDDRETDLFKCSSSIKYKHSFTCQSEVSFQNGLAVRAWGVGHSGPGEGTTRSKKRSVTNAYRGCFANVAIVRLASGKVDVRQILFDSPQPLPKINIATNSRPNINGTKTLYSTLKK